MKGIVFNLLEEVVVEHHGEATWDHLLAATDLDGSYTSLGSYPDEHMAALVGAASSALGVSGNEILRWFGQQAMPLLFARYPGFFQAQPSLRQFVLSVNGIIHPEVRKVYPGAQVPIFDLTEQPDGSLLMGYHSSRRLCALAQGFAEGAAKQYGEPLQFSHLRCMHQGDSECLCHLCFEGAEC